MNPRLALHKDFVEKLVTRRHGVLGRWVKGKGWPDLPENQPINQFLTKLSPEDKDVLVAILQEARDGGVHDALVVLHTEMANGLRLVKDGVEMAFEPYHSEIYYDWVARCAGDDWPESQLREEYK
jgi:hypothetical protein